MLPTYRGIRTIRSRLSDRPGIQPGVGTSDCPKEKSRNPSDPHTRRGTGNDGACTTPSETDKCGCQVAGSSLATMVSRDDGDSSSW